LCEAIQSPYRRAFDFFRDAATESRLFSTLAQFLSEAPEFLASLRFVYPDPTALKAFLKRLLRENATGFFNSLFRGHNLIPESILNMIVSVIRSHVDSLRQYLGRAPPDLLPAIFSFLFQFGFLSSIPHLNQSAVVEVEAAASQYFSSHRKEFLAALPKFTDPRVSAALLPDLLESPLYDQADDFVQAVLAAPYLCRSCGLPARIFVDLALRRPRFLPAVARILADSPADTELTQLLAAACPEAFLAVLHDGDRDPASANHFRQLVENPALPFPSPAFFERLQPYLEQVSPAEVFAPNPLALLDQPRWVNLFCTNFFFFAAFVQAARELKDRGQVRHLVVTYVDGHHAIMASSWSEFRRVASFLVSVFAVAELPLWQQVKLFACLAGHCGALESPDDRRLAFAFLKALGATEAVFEAADAFSRAAIFPFLIGGLWNARAAPEYDHTFEYHTWFLFEFNPDPFRDCAVSVRHGILLLNARNAAAVKKMLTRRPAVRANWLRSVLRVAREEQTAPVIGTVEFLPLVTQVMLDAMGTPAVWDCASDLEFMDLLLAFMNAGNEFKVTKDALRVIVQRAKSGRPTARHNQEVFQRLLLSDAINRALARNG
jgi:hypothetical protein